MKTLPNITEFTVNRSGWLTALTTDTTSSLRDPTNGRKCCLGFAMEKCGVEPKDMNGVLYPRDLFAGAIEQAQFIVPWANKGARNTELSRLAARINDDEKISGAEREESLIALFGKHGISLTFID